MFTPSRPVPLFIAIFTVLAVPAAHAQTKTASRNTSSSPNMPLFLPAVPFNAGGEATSQVAVADVNGDGKADLVVVIGNAGGGSLESKGLVGVLLGNGDGTFQTAVTYATEGYNPSSVAVADLNADGKPDIVVSNQCIWIGQTCSYTTVGILFGNGHGTFQPLVTLNPGGPMAGPIVVADLNGDGKPDIVLTVSPPSAICAVYST